MLYYWANVLVTVPRWFAQPRDNLLLHLRQRYLCSYASLSNLPFRGPQSSPALTTPMKTTLLVWEQARAQYVADDTYSPFTPLWGNPNLSHFHTIPDPSLWARYAITLLKHIMPQGSLLSINMLQDCYRLPNHMLFQFLQLRHAAGAQFPRNVKLTSDHLEQLLSSKDLSTLLSALYSQLFPLTLIKMTDLYNKWWADIPSLTEDD